MTDPRVREILARLSQPNRHRLSWPERIMWGVTTALWAITLLSLLSCSEGPPQSRDADEALTCYHTLADMDAATTVEAAWGVCHPDETEGPKADERTRSILRWAERHAVVEACDGLTYELVHDTLIITARCREWP